jgi:hypothetical protein
MSSWARVFVFRMCSRRRTHVLWRCGSSLILPCTGDMSVNFVPSHQLDRLSAHVVRDGIICHCHPGPHVGDLTQPRCTCRTYLRSSWYIDTCYCWIRSTTISLSLKMNLLTWPEDIRIHAFIAISSSIRTVIAVASAYCRELGRRLR